MRNVLMKIFGNEVYLKIEKVKKSFFPTEFDKLQKQSFEQQFKFYSSFIKPGDLCFDIGGNVGDKTNIFLNLNAKVVVVEPQGECIEILKKRFQNKATILQNGVGAENEVKDFYVSNNSQLSSFDKNWISDLESTRFSNTVVQKVEKIEIVTLDNLIENYGTADFIKIDVEGYEIEVLKGLNQKFGMLSFEYAVPEKLNLVINCLEHLKEKFNKLVCNYSEGNSTANFKFENWISIEDMISYVKEDSFTNSFAGDIYIKN